MILNDTTIIIIITMAMTKKKMTMIPKMMAMTMMMRTALTKMMILTMTLRASDIDNCIDNISDNDDERDDVNENDNTATMMMILAVAATKIMSNSDDN